jgi:hypothetical protein
MLAIVIGTIIGLLGIWYYDSLAQKIWCLMIYSFRIYGLL